MTTVRFAIIGPGKIAEARLAPAIQQVPGAELWSVLSRDLARARDFAERHGARSSEPAHTDLDGLLGDPKLTAVIIASPDALHASQAVAAARAGKHVFVEKPMATTVADASAMVTACQNANVRLGIAYHLRWHAGHRALAHEVHAGALGELRHMRVHWTYRAGDASNWRASVEVGRWWSLAGVGTHGIDLVRWMMMPSCGEVVDLVALTTRSVFKGPHDETALVMMRFASGATAEVVTSVLFDSMPMIDIYGVTASAACEGTLGPHGTGRVRSRGAELAFTPHNPYVGEVADFVAAIREGRAPEVDGAEGLRNVELLERAAPQKC
jgi:1,5-anhydro-D-fructose reductase (1,5-anhydro-D-mannitol-forming)